MGHPQERPARPPHHLDPRQETPILSPNSPSPPHRPLPARPSGGEETEGTGLDKHSQNVIDILEV